VNDATPSTAVYAYCVVRAEAVPDAAAAPAGPPGASSARALEIAPGLWLIAAEVPLPDYAAATLEERLGDLEWVSDRALAHEAVIEHFAGAPRSLPVVPLPLFTLFADEERARAAMAAQRARLDHALERTAGCAEWGIKVLTDAAARAVSDRAAEPAAPPRSGTEFLQRKVQARTAAQDRSARARAEAAALFDDLAGAARAAVRKPPPEGAAGSRLLLDAAFLVPHGGAAAFEERIAARTGALGDAGCSVTLSGPWPPYHFVGDARGEPA
jgi:hypothetical protein